MAEVRAAFLRDVRREDDAELLAEVADELVDHGLPGGRGEARDRGDRRVGALGERPDEARGVEVVGAEVVAPLREAVRLVEHPRADLPVFERLAERAIPELLRRDEDDGEGAAPEALEHLRALERREQAVDRADGARLRLSLERLDLVLHQRLERRDDDGERAVSAVPDERGELVAERLAGAGG